MAYMTLADFMKAVDFDHYIKFDSWFGWNKPFDLISSWRLYKIARQQRDDFIILGDTKLRKDPKLVAAFGLISARRSQDPDEVNMIAALTIQQWWRHVDTPNIGTGRILSDQNWSPLLNDSLIIGGAHSRTEFHFTDDLLQKYSFQNLSCDVNCDSLAKEMKAVVQLYNLADLSDQTWAVQVWRHFIQCNMSVLMDNSKHIPRVLARELIGLMAFGYEAQPMEQQLSFAPTGNVDSASFKVYHDSLRRAGYYDVEFQKMLSTISNYIFKHPEALRVV
jgi:hypothetical protein